MSDRNTVRQIVFDFLSDANPIVVANLAQLNADFNLLENGYIDSFGFVDLLRLLEEKTGVTIDFTEADPSELATLGGLERHYCS